MALREGVDYVVRGGSLNHLVFRVIFGLRRNYRQMADLESVGSSGKLVITTTDEAEKLPLGPPMPQAGLRLLAPLLEGSNETDTIREAFCVGFVGEGYEIGAGRRPTIVPLNCKVTYVDRFTFEEAKSGSFIGLENKNFVPVSIFEPMDDLKSIPDSSADFFVACHVIEHVPNVIAAIKEVMRKLRPGKPLFLVVPHKEWMFDAQRPTTSIEHFIADEHSSAPPMLEHYLEYSRRSKLTPNWEDDGRAMCEAKSDFHVHTFTPESMISLLAFLHARGIIGPFEVKQPARAQLGEFYVTVRNR